MSSNPNTTILNLTQHVGTPEQGVLEPSRKAEVQEIITFEGDDLPAEWDEVKALYERRADALATLASEEFDLLGVPEGGRAAMIGGAPYFQKPLEEALAGRGITPLYSFSERVSEDVPQPDGSTKKVSKFKHVRFVPGMCS
jgi:hypothetical protein